MSPVGWVVICDKREGGDGKCAVVTDVTKAPEGTRVVRGREGEVCREHYRSQQGQS